MVFLSAFRVGDREAAIPALLEPADRQTLSWGYL
jgi:hypothetical protein